MVKTGRMPRVGCRFRIPGVVAKHGVTAVAPLPRLRYLDRMTPDEIEAAFTRSDGTFLFTRWGRPIAPVVFGVDDATLNTVKGAIEAFSALTGHPLAETDPELGSNLMIFFMRDWEELLEVKDLDRLIPDLGPLVQKLRAADANQYRVFRMDTNNAIRACFVFVRMDDDLSKLPAEAVALAQVVQSALLWSDTMFSGSGPLAMSDGVLILRPEIADLLRAAYDPVIPSVSTEPATALRLAARLPQAQ